MRSEDLLAEFALLESPAAIVKSAPVEQGPCHAEESPPAATTDAFARFQLLCDRAVVGFQRIAERKQEELNEAVEMISIFTEMKAVLSGGPLEETEDEDESEDINLEEDVDDDEEDGVKEEGTLSAAEEEGKDEEGLSEESGDHDLDSSGGGPGGEGANALWRTLREVRPQVPNSRLRGEPAPRALPAANGTRVNGKSDQPEV